MHCIVPNITLALYQNQEINGLEGEWKELKLKKNKRSPATKKIPATLARQIPGSKKVSV